MKHESEFIPFETCELPAGPYLVFAPHPDDETIGMGGTIALAAEQGIAVTVVVVTDGAHGSDAAERRQEMHRAAGVLGIAEVVFLEMEDRRVAADGLPRERLCELMDSVQPGAVFLPSLSEYHPDHRAVTSGVWQLLADTGGSVPVWTYEIARQGEANRLVDITRVVDRKTKALECFCSQTAKRPYVGLMLALGRLRTYSLPAEVTHAEAFWCVGPATHTRPSARVRADGEDAAALPVQGPLVSVVVRTRDRPALLKEALHSVADQDYRPLEAVIVNDGGCDVAALVGTFRDRIPGVRYVDLPRNRGRAAAANAGIRAAGGDLIAFLDDDDLLTPDSIACRVRAFTNTDAAATYGAVRCEAINPGPPAGANGDQAVLFAHDWKPDVLRFQNLYPLTAFLFTRRLFDRHGMFDESFECFEDWELLLRVAEHESFHFVDKLVSIYRVFSGSTVRGDRFPPDVVARHEERLYAVYLKDWINNRRVHDYAAFLEQQHRERNGQLAGRMEGQAEQIRTLAGRIEDSEDEVRSLSHSLHWTRQEMVRVREELSERYQRQIRDLAGTVHELLRQLDWVTSSLSWRVTSPLRGLTVFLRRLVSPGFEDRSPVLGVQEPACLRAGPARPGPVDAGAACDGEHDETALVSVITVVGEPQPPFLVDLLQSMRAQCHPQWELLVVDNDALDGEARQVLEQHAAQDTRIRAIRPGAAVPLPEAYSGAAAEARGGFLTFVEDTGTLDPAALCQVVRAFRRNPDAAIVYSDEDTIDPSGAPGVAFFKPDWSPETFPGSGYVGHLAVFRASAVAAVDGFRVTCPTACHYDLILRVSENGGVVEHVPRILYHSRCAAAPAGADDRSDAPWGRADEDALRQALARRGETASVEPVADAPGRFLVRYAYTGRARVSIVIPTRDRSRFLDTCLSSIARESTYRHFEIIVVDDESKEAETAALFRKWYAKLGSAFRVERMDGPFNYSRLNNHGASVANGEYLCFLNNDVKVLTPTWLEDMLGYACRDAIGAVGARLLYPDHTIQHAGVVLGLWGVAGHGHRRFPADHPGYFDRLKTVSNCAAVTGACMMLTKQGFEEVGGLDEQLAVTFNDVDLCLKLGAKGYRNVTLPYVRLYHYESVSRGQDDTPEKQQRFLRERDLVRERWLPVLENDPYYSPHLTRLGEDFSPAAGGPS